MLNHPDTDLPTPSSSKLVLPDLSDEEQRVASGQFRAQIHPGLLIRQTTPPAPKKVLPKLAWYWRKDPAYKVFMIAIAMVVVASIVLVSLVSSALFGHSSSGASLSLTPPAKVTPRCTVDLVPPRPPGADPMTQAPLANRFADYARHAEWLLGDLERHEDRYCGAILADVRRAAVQESPSAPCPSSASGEHGEVRA